MVGLWWCTHKRSAQQKRQVVVGWDAQFPPLEPAPDALNVALLGLPGAGKSHVINRLRRLQFGDTGFADVGTSTTTEAVTPYIWETEAGRICLYDIPGIGGRFAPDWDPEQCLLYVKDMDVVVMVYNNTVTPFDTKVARLAASQADPLLLVVRTKADMLVADMQKTLQPENYTAATTEACARVESEATELGAELTGRLFLVASSKEEDEAITCSAAGSSSILQDKLTEECKFLSSQVPMCGVPLLAQAV